MNSLPRRSMEPGIESMAPESVTAEDGWETGAKAAAEARREARTTVFMVTGWKSRRKVTIERDRDRLPIVHVFVTRHCRVPTHLRSLCHAFSLKNVTKRQITSA